MYVEKLFSFGQYFVNARFIDSYQQLSRVIYQAHTLSNIYYIVNCNKSYHNIRQQYNRCIMHIRISSALLRNSYHSKQHLSNGQPFQLATINAASTQLRQFLVCDKYILSHMISSHRNKHNGAISIMSNFYIYKLLFLQYLYLDSFEDYAVDEKKIYSIFFTFYFFYLLINCITIQLTF